MSTTASITGNGAADDETVFDRGVGICHGCLSKLFDSCEDDPKGSIHRAWGISLIFVILYFILSIVEMINLHSKGGSRALVVAAIWTGIIHLVLGVLGTFVLKRFPTSFSVGFFLGVLVVLSSQNLILFGTFHGYNYGNIGTNNAFANVGLTLFVILTFFSLLLFHFKRHVVVAPIDAKGLRGSSAATAQAITHHATASVDEASDYQTYEERVDD